MNANKKSRGYYMPEQPTGWIWVVSSQEQERLEKAIEWHREQEKKEKVR